MSYGSMDTLSLTSNSLSRSISPENFTGEKGKAGAATQGTGAHAARELGQGWKISPSVHIKAHETFTLADVTGPGTVTHLWMTPTGDWSHEIIRFYWDNDPTPAIECPVGNFFACGLGQYAQVNSLPICVNPGSAFNCYWKMPFHKSMRVTLENTAAKDMTLYYQLSYSLGEIPANSAYLHAQYNHTPAVENGLYTILDTVHGTGQYVGTYMTYHAKSDGWWGEGEIKFFIDGDKDFPTIAGTGTEDYFCGSYDFVRNHKYTIFSTPYTGLVQILGNETAEKADQRLSLYRWHITDPIRFQKDLKVTIQDLGWQSEGRYKKLADEISTVAFWYQQP